jgi:hypothetical protein
MDIFDLLSDNDGITPELYSSNELIAKQESPINAKPPLTTAALIGGGFVWTSRWVRTSRGKLGLQEPLPKAPGVYAFVRDGIALYVGIAASGLAARFSAYISPASQYRTAQRLHARLLLALGTAPYLDILTAAPPNSCWNGWPVNASAGLEVGLIENFDLPWNFRGAGKRRGRRHRGNGQETARFMPIRAP